MEEGGQRESVPLCVDLDGTLLRCDSLVESLWRMLRTDPLLLFRMPRWIGRGRAWLKGEIANRVALDPAELPYNEELLEFLRARAAGGQPLYLVTATHIRPARTVATHLGLFAGVIATDGKRNLKGREKRDELVRRFGERGFDYAGDSSADLDVWPAAREAIVVNASASSARVARKLGDRAADVIESPRRSLPLVVLEAMRVRQWVKNLLVLLPVALAHRVLEPTPLFHALLAFLAFGLGASAVYVLNDLLDLEADRHHPVKRERPFAAGELPLQTGLVLVPLLVVPSLVIALVLPRSFLLVLLLYFVLTTAYSLVLKEIALVDVLLLASLYTLRIIAGAEATEVVVSEWLLAFSMFIFLSLAALKRYAELRRLRSEDSAETKVKGRGYLAGDLELMVPMGMCSGYLAVLVLALYISSDSVAPLYSRPVLLWFVCPLMLYWISRVWFLAHRGQVEDDPLSFAVRDRTTWVVALLSAGIVLAATGVT
jgi:4-hydroxybenzoate polyprenyltransferase/phosphoserine phosphatase